MTPATTLGSSVAVDSLASRLPITVITGFLGSGKTTLLRRLLRHPGMSRAAVIINEFGDVAIDHELVAACATSHVNRSKRCLWPWERSAVTELSLSECQIECGLEPREDLPMASADRVGVIGLGIMGSAMSANLIGAGFSVQGYDVLARRRSEFSQAGGRPARNVRELAQRAPVVITSLPSSAALLKVAAELAKARHSGQIVVETSTLPIAIKEQAKKLLAVQGVTLLDCPLSGTGAQARVKDLAVYASGLRSAYRRCTPIFEGFARTHFFLGPFGAGSKMKFLANLLVAIHNVSTAEALVLGMKAGLDPATMVRVLGDGAGSSRMLQVRGPMMVRNDYTDATMKVGVWQKDMRIITDFARELDCPTPLFAATSAIYNAAMAQGFAEADTAAVCAVLESWAKTGRRPARR